MSAQQPEPQAGSTLQAGHVASFQAAGAEHQGALVPGAAACAALREVLPTVLQLQGVVPGHRHGFWSILSRVLFPGVDNRSE